MKKIKIRAWDSFKKQMIYEFSDEFGNEMYDVCLLDGMLSVIGFDNLWEPYSPELLQYTGLKDKNGKEIYERDIVKWGHVKGGEERIIRIAVVKINPDIQFELIPSVSKHFSGAFGDNKIFRYGQFAYKDTKMWLEVIGNIYENKDLLNES